MGGHRASEVVPEPDLVIRPAEFGEVSVEGFQDAREERAFRLA